MQAYVLDWLNLLARWVHFVAGISWIGASFYFVWLDNHLKPPARPGDAAHGVSGELWAVHGGGFYHNQKFLTGPKGEPLPRDLHWFKWEAYSTWLSGMALLAIVYWAGAGTYLIDRSVLDLSPAAAIAISIASLIAGWLIYDALCKLLGERPALLGATVYALLVLAAWGLFHVFGARAAFMHVGAIVGTIMVANVLFVIIPGQRKMLDEIRAGREPDPRPGRLGKMRSVHNTYFTLPVLFIMISGHYPMTYAGANGWIVLALISAAAVLVRHFFILSHKDTFAPALPAVAILLLVAVAIALAPHGGSMAGSSTVTFAQIQPIVAQRCAVCHAAKPTQPGFASAPLGVVLDTPQAIQSNAQRVGQQAVATQAMPIGNVTNMTPAERKLLGDWIAGGAKL